MTDQKVSRRRPSSTKAVTMRVGRVGMMYPNSTMVEIVKKKASHINSHTGSNLQPGASQKDIEFSKWK